MAATGGQPDGERGELARGGSVSGAVASPAWRLADDYVRVVSKDVSLIRELIFDAARDYQPRLHSSSMS